ncbi:unnamed protein product [Polarella glacialis]|uniref:Luciferase domain-containing protein n=1 Tax=Polarella glacialis TaxID=89957 RepID=A0A813GGC9_POLGL|nr:unnamed protein product [Polarella glacialis]CAE8625362.1 unnamed protein product [Polarella glacialis]
MATTAPCFVLSKSVPLPGVLADRHKVCEFAHIHIECNPEWGWTSQQGGGRGSQHTTLAPRDAKRLIELRWAGWHPLSTTGHPLVLVYAPRDDAESELCLRLYAFPWLVIVSSKGLESSNYLLEDLVPGQVDMHATKAASFLQ